jgi:hypothetical protein
MTTIAAIAPLIAIYCLAAAGLGMALLRLGGASFGHQSVGAGNALATALLLGEGVLANVWLGIALCGQLRPAVIVPVMAVCLLAGARPLWRTLCAVPAETASVARATWRSGPAWMAVAGGALFLAAAALTTTAAPMGGDALNWYMTVGKVIGESHRIAILPQKEHFMAFGLQGEMHFAVLMALGAGELARALAWPSALAGAVMLLSLCRKAGCGVRGQWLALGMMFSSSLVLVFFGDGKVDMFSMPLGLAALNWAMTPVSPLLAGVFFGIAVVAKTVYAPSLAVAAGVLLAWSRLSKLSTGGDFSGIRDWFRSWVVGGLVLAVGAILGAAPHLVKNTVILGNVGAAYGGDITMFMGWETGWPHWYDKRIYLTLPLDLTFQYIGNPSPLVLAFAPLALLFPRRNLRALVRSPLTAIGVATALSVYTHLLIFPTLLVEERYLMPVLLLAIAFAARAAEHAATTGGPATRWVIVAITLVSQSAVYERMKGWGVLPFSALASPVDSCAAHPLPCKTQLTANDHIGRGERLIFSNCHSYWLRSDLRQCVNGKADNDALAAAAKNSPESLWRELQRRGFRYALDGGDCPAFVFPSGGPVPDWLRLVPLYSERGMTLYRLDFSDLAPRQTLQCREDGRGGWDVGPP